MNNATHLSRWRVLSFDVIIPTLMITVCFFLLFKPILQAEFDFIDDHDIIRLASEESVNPNFQLTFKPPNDLQTIIEMELALQRFRPFYRIMRSLEANVLGTDSHAWHLYRLLMGIWTSVLLFMSARFMKVPRWLAMVMIILIVFQANANEIWYKLGPAETQGMLLIAIALYTTVYTANKTQFSFGDSIMLFSLALAGWSKESFILLIPAFVVLRFGLCIWFNPTYSLLSILRSLYVLILLSFILFSIQLVTVLSLVSTNYIEAPQYASTSSNIDAWLSLLSFMMNRQFDFIPAFIGIILTFIGWYYHPRSLYRLEYLAIASLFIILWIIPQFILYGGSEGFANSRYSYPVIIGFVLINIFPLASASSYFPRITSILIIPIIIFFAYHQGLETHRLTSQFTVVTQTYDDMLSFLVNSTTLTQDDYLIIDTNLISEYERTFATMIFIDSKAIKNPIAFHFSQRDSQNDSSGLDDSFRSILTNYQTSDDITPEQAQFILLLLPNDSFLTNPPSWFNPDDYTRWEMVRGYNSPLPWLPQPLAIASFVFYERKD